MPRGRHPKHPGLRQNRTKKAGRAQLSPVDPDAAIKPPPLQNPDKRKWHRLTRAWWKRVWQSPMASEYLPTDIDGLARLAILVDNYYVHPHKDLAGEIRLQEARFGLSPMDRGRLQWEVQRGEEAERKRKSPQHKRSSGKDPRANLPGSDTGLKVVK